VMSAWAFCLLRNQKVGFELVSPGQCRIAPGDDHGGGAGPALVDGAVNDHSVEKHFAILQVPVPVRLG